MGLFDFLKKSNPPPPSGGGKAGGGSSGGPVDKKIVSLGKVVADKRAQTYDRQEALQALVEMRSADAAAALLKRFTFAIDPSITDQEEKDLAFRGIVETGADAVTAVVDFCVKAETLTWPLKILHELLDDEDYQRELLTILERFDTEYARNVDPKIQVIVALEEQVSEEVREGVEPFLEDVNETVRFHAVQTTFNQGNDVCVPALVKLLETEESVRIKNKVAEGLQFRGWVIPAELREAAAKALRESSGFSVGSDGKVTKRAGY